MNSSQLYNALKVILKPVKIKQFDVLAADELETILFGNKSYPKVYIFNVLPSFSPKTMGHWLVVYALSSNQYEIFDSFGKNLLFYSKRFYNKILSKSVIFNKKSVQNIDSLVCGKYALYYIAKRIKGLSMKKITSVFTRNTLKNDEIVNKFYRTVMTNVISHHHCTKISCSKREFLCKNIIYCK
jgi:hypothetical protein